MDATKTKDLTEMAELRKIYFETQDLTAREKFTELAVKQFEAGGVKDAAGNTVTLVATLDSRYGWTGTAVSTGRHGVPVMFDGGGACNTQEEALRHAAYSFYMFDWAKKFAEVRIVR